MLNRIDGNIHLFAATNNAGVRWLEIDERAKSTRSLSLRARLECVAGQNQCNDEDDGFVVDVGSNTVTDEESRHYRCYRRIDERRAGTNGDQRVHVRRAV